MLKPILPPAALTGADQIELTKAAISLQRALGGRLRHHRTLFFTNRDKEAQQRLPQKLCVATKSCLVAGV